ncbi:MAG: DUF5362 family protein [Luteolibacter sp.]
MNLPPPPKAYQLRAMSFDPYTAPSLSHQAIAAPGNAVDPEAIRMLQMTRPWVRVCSILAFIAGGFMALGGIAIVIGGLVFSMSPQRSPNAMFPAGVGIVYIVVAALYIFPAIKLWRYGTAITSLMGTGASSDLVRAMDQQRSFWKFVGIMACVSIVLFGISFVIGMLGAFMASKSPI